MDGSDYVHDEILVKLWREYRKFYRPDITYDTVYHINYHTVRYIYRDNFRL